METDKPQISILMAVYEPRMDWLREQLLSLNAQTYPNLKLYVCDDCSATISFGDIQDLVAECITKFPYQIMRNDQNVGSNLTFERLTQEAEGNYFAYCDQDDIWLPEKLVILQESIEHINTLLVCSDMYIIDEESKQVAQSITQVRKNHVFFSGENLAKKLLFHNWVTGCTMMLRAQTAKKAVPFCPYMVHDQYLALYCAAIGQIKCVKQSLIQYRIHTNNQTGIMTGIKSRKQYLELRICLLKQRMQWLLKNFPISDPTLTECFRCGLIWMVAREKNLTHQGGKWIVWKYRRFGLRVALFELFAPYMSDRLFLYIIDLVKKNKL